MKKPRLLVALGLAVLLVILVAGAAVAAQSAGLINWQVFSGGGAPAATTGNAVSLNGSLGQTIIGNSSSTSYGLNAGYWLKATGQELFLPVVMRSN